MAIPNYPTALSVATTAAATATATTATATIATVTPISWTVGNGSEFTAALLSSLFVVASHRMDRSIGAKLCGQISQLVAGDIVCHVGAWNTHTHTHTHTHTGPTRTCMMKHRFHGGKLNRKITSPVSIFNWYQLWSSLSELSRRGEEVGEKGGKLPWACKAALPALPASFHPLVRLNRIRSLRFFIKLIKVDLMTVTFPLCVRSIECERESIKLTLSLSLSPPPARHLLPTAYRVLNTRNRNPEPHMEHVNLLSVYIEDDPLKPALDSIWT